MRLHIRAQDGIDAGLVAALLAEPAEQVGVQAHSHDFFWRRHDDFGAPPEFWVGGAGVGVGCDGSVVPPGQTFSLGLAFPALETPGYFQESLRDLGPIALHAFPFWNGYFLGGGISLLWVRGVSILG
jgi:hypothetical protein